MTTLLGFLGFIACCVFIWINEAREYKRWNNAWEKAHKEEHDETH